jgi:hypothetical protein
MFGHWVMLGLTEILILGLLGAGVVGVVVLIVWATASGKRDQD